MFAIAFSIISITTGIFLNYGFGLSVLGPGIDLDLADRRRGQPDDRAGGSRAWHQDPAGRLRLSVELAAGEPTYGWFVGFAGLLYMTVGGAAIMYTVAAPLLLSEFNYTTPNPRLVLAVAIIMMLLPVVFNIISIQVAARVNNIAVFTEIIGTVVFGVLLFVLWALKTKPTPYGASILTNTTSVLPQPDHLRVRAGRPDRRVHPRRVRASRRHVRGRGQPAHERAARGDLGRRSLGDPGHDRPDRLHHRDPELQGGRGAAPLPLLIIAGYWLPSWLVKVFIAFVIFSMFAILVVGAGAQARLGYSMARDNMLPFSGLLRRVNPRTQTPIVALLVFAVIDIGALFYGYLQTSAFLTLVGATAIIPYIIYFLITAGYAYKRRTLDSIPGVFSLGRWAWPVIIFVLVYSALIIFVLSAPGPFHSSDKVVGYGAGVALLWYVCALVWRLRRGTAGVKPIEDFAD